MIFPSREMGQKLEGSCPDSIEINKRRTRILPYNLQDSSRITGLSCFNVTAESGDKQARAGKTSESIIPFVVKPLGEILDELQTEKAFTLTN